MRKENRTEDRTEKAKIGSYAEVVTQGSAMGVLMWCSSILYLSLTRNAEGLLAYMPWMLPALLAFILAGILLQWAFFYKQLIGGLSAYYWVFMLTLGGSFTAHLIQADWIRMMILVAFLMVTGIFAVRFYLLGRLAKELNGNRLPLSLCIGLKDKPASREEFFQKFEAYCTGERLEFEYESRELPALVQIDGKRCQIRLDSVPGLGGADYFIRITEL